MEPICIWDMDDEPEGNVAHIEEHGITQDEVEDVVQNPRNPTDVSESTGRPITFGMTRTGKYIETVASIQSNWYDGGGVD